MMEFNEVTIEGKSRYNNKFFLWSALGWKNSKI
jgi:hypothetical protein